MSETTNNPSPELRIALQKLNLDPQEILERAVHKRLHDFIPVCPLTDKVCINPNGSCNECSIVKTRIVPRTNVCVIGIGTVGFPTALQINKHHQVYGYDIDPDKTEKANSHFLSKRDWKEIPKTDVYVVCVNTWWHNNPDMSAIYDVCDQINDCGDAKLVCIESTVNVGTCRKIWKEIFNERIPVACCPHRLWPKDLKKYGVRQNRVLGELNVSNDYSSSDFYKSINIPFRLVAPIEVAELSKIAENSYYFVQIAFAEELSILCEELDLHFKSVRDAINTHFRFSHPEARLREARDGIGGTCLPKDIRFLNSVAATPKPLIAAAILADELYQEKLKRRKWR